LTPPEERPVCQKRWRNKKATISGMIDTSEPVMMVEIEGLGPRPAAGRGLALRQPHGQRELLRRVEHDQRQEVGRTSLTA
jgi:hypothetical protein